MQDIYRIVAGSRARPGKVIGIYRTRTSAVRHWPQGEVYLEREIVSDARFYQMLDEGMQ